MAVPKQKSSKSRTRRRRAHKSITPKSLVKCPHCGKSMMPHHVCPNCGFYKGKEIIDVLKKVGK